MIGVQVTVPIVAPALNPMIRYDVIGAPPVLSGASQLMTGPPLSLCATSTAVGRSGTEAGVMVVEKLDAGPLPALFDANTLNR